MQKIFTSFLLVIAVLWATLPGTFAQELKPKGTFQADSLKIGEPITYTLTFQYPRGFEVVFPGEEDDYLPFEYIDRTFAPTRSDSLLSFDSVVYQLTTFELDLVQRLALPVYVIENGDSTAIYARPDSVYLKELLPEVPDTVNVKENVAYRSIELAFNYPYLLVGIGAFLLVVVLVYIFFGKTIQKRWRLYRLQKAYQQFQESFSKELEALRTAPDRRRTEKVLIAWKKYMEKLEGQPYMKMTTKEILKLPSAEAVTQDLRAIDRNIYGNMQNGEVVGYFEKLQTFSNQRYHHKVEAIKKG